MYLDGHQADSVGRNDCTMHMVRDTRYGRRPMKSSLRRTNHKYDRSILHMKLSSIVT